MNYKKCFIPILVVSLLLITTYFVYGIGVLTDGGLTIVGPTANSYYYATQSITLDATLATGNGTTNLTWFAIPGLTFLAATNSSNVTDFANIVISSNANTGQGWHNISLNATDTVPNAWTNWSHTAGPYVLNLTQNIYIVRNLNASRNVTISSPTAGQNISGTMTMQALIDIDSVVTNTTWFIVNQTAAGQNTTLVTINTLNDLNSTFVTNTLSDGTYWLYINVTNQSAATRTEGPANYDDFQIRINITIDNSQPQLLIATSDSDNVLFTRSEQIVTCTASDGLSNIRDLVVEIEKPSGTKVTKTVNSGDSASFNDEDTSRTGPYKARCIATDYAGNVIIKESSFDVRVRSSSGSSASKAN